MGSSIVVVGSINADLTVQVARHPSPGETLMGSGGTVNAGGKGANQAVAAALLGADVALVGAVGDDGNATPATAYLRSSGVNLSAVEAFAETPTGLAVVTVADDGENAIIVVPGANARVDADYVASHANLIGAASIVLLQGEIPADGFREAVSLARGRVVVNLAPVVAVDREALLAANPLLANEHEAGLILQQLGLDAEGGPQELAERLLGAGFASVVLTLGSQGALVVTPEGTTPVPAATVKAVDTTGAGDAFAGALVARLDAGDDLVAAARFAGRVGAYAATGAGAQPSYPDSAASLPPLAE